MPQELEADEVSAWTQERRPATTPAAPSPPAGTGGVLAAEELRVSVEGNTHRVGLDYGDALAWVA